jgi:hypothetical protein
MGADEDQAWLEALAGRRAATPASASTQEAHALRALVQTQTPPDAAAAANVDPARAAALIERARAEGLLPQRAAPRQGWRSRMASRPALAAAAVATLAVAIAVTRYLTPPTEALRSGGLETVRLEAHDPQALRQELIQELRAAGVRVSGYEQFGRIGIDADLPQPLTPQVRGVLARHGIPVPGDGALVVVITASGER